MEDVEEKIILNGYMEIIQGMYERIVQELCGKIIEFQIKLKESAFKPYLFF